MEIPRVTFIFTGFPVIPEIDWKKNSKVGSKKTENPLKARKTKVVFFRRDRFDFSPQTNRMKYHKTFFCIQLETKKA